MPSSDSRADLLVEPRPENDDDEAALKNAPVIDKIPGRCGGRACLAGTRLYVSLFEGMRRRGVSKLWMLENWPYITHDQLMACFEYADKNRQEIDAEIGGNAEGEDVEWYEGKLISERAAEIARERRARTGVYGGWSQEIGDVVRALDERLGRG